MRALIKKSSKNIYIELFLALIFVTGIAMGLYIWPHIFIASSPGDIIGPLILKGESPVTNIVRFIVFITVPCLLFLITSLFYPFLKSIRDTKANIKDDSKKHQLLSLSLGIVFFIILGLNIPSYHGWDGFDSFHEGEALGAAESYQRGEIPYKDYVIYHGLVQDPLRVIAGFDIFSNSIGSARTFESILKIITYSLVAVLLWVLFRKKTVFYVLSLIIFSILHFMNLLGVDNNNLIILSREIPVLLLIISSLLLYQYSRKKQHSSKKILFLSIAMSLMFVGSMVYSVDRGLYMILVYPVALLSLFLNFRGRDRTIYLLGNCVGFIFGMLLFYTLLRGSLGDFIDFVFTEIPKNVEPMFGLSYPIDSPAFGLAITLVAFNTFWLCTRFFQTKGNIFQKTRLFIERHYIILILFVLSVATFRGALGRSDVEHLSYSLWPTVLLTFYIFITNYIPRILNRYAARKVFIISSIIVLIFVISLGSYRVGRKDLLAKNFPYKISDQSYIPSGYFAAIDFFKRNLGNDDYFITLTSEAGWYYFVDKKSPTRFGVIWFASTPEYQSEVISDLSSKNIKYVLYKNEFWANSIDGISNQTRMPILYRYIHDNYEPHININGNEIWIKKVEPAKPNL